MNGIVQSFRIDFDYHTHKCQPAKQNMISAKKNPLIVEEPIDCRRVPVQREGGRTGGGPTPQGKRVRCTD